MGVLNFEAFSAAWLHAWGVAVSTNSLLMRVLVPLVLCLALAPTASAQQAAQVPDFDFFKNEVQPIFLAPWSRRYRT